MSNYENKITVLYISHTALWGGAALSLFNMIHSLSDYIKPIVLVPAKGDISDYCYRKGIECIIQNFSWNLKSEKKHLYKPDWLVLCKKKIVDWICSYKVCNYLENCKIDIVHSNASVITVGVNLSKMLHAKHIWHIREFQDLDFNMTPLTGWERLKNKIYAADAIIAISNAVYCHWGLGKRKNSHMVWNAVINEKETVCYEANKEPYFFFSAAAISQAKGLDLVLEAFAQSHLQEKGYKLLIAGRLEGEYKEIIDRLLIKYKLKSYVIFLGFCNDLKKYVRNATAFVMSSRNEALGRVTVESMFYGCPVIGKNAGGTLELIKDNETGFLFANAQECAEKMLYVVHHDVTTIIRNAQHFVLSNFTEECYKHKMLKIYQSILGLV